MTAAIVVGCAGASPTRSMLERVQVDVLRERFTSGRLVKQGWQACADHDTTRLVPRTVCDNGQPREAAVLDKRFTALVTAVNRADAQGTDPNVQHARSLLQLRSAKASPSMLDRAVASLEAAREASHGDAAVLNDLAVAYLEVAVRDQHLAPMLNALDAVEQALQLDSTLTEARFNRALILERLYLVGEARKAWSAYVDTSPRDEWSRVAANHLRKLTTLADLAAGSVDFQQARDDYFRLLGAWGSATKIGTPERADSLLRVAYRAGDSLAALTPDETLPRTARWLARYAEADPGAIGSSLVDFATGLALNDSASYERADSTLARAERSLRRIGFPAAHWVSYARAVAQANYGDTADADARLRMILREAEAHEPAVAGKALWMRGVIELRKGNYESAIDLYRRARPYLAAAMDRRNAAAVSYLLTEALALAGQSVMSMEEGFSGLRGLSSFRRSIYLSNHLTIIAAAARASGLRYAALAIVGEALAINATLGRSDALASVLAAQARDFATVGDTGAAIRALREAEVAARRLPGSSRRFALAGVDLERGRLRDARALDSAAARLTRAADAFKGLQRWLYVPPTLYELAMVARHRGDAAAELTWLQQAIDVVERQRTAFTSAEARSAFYETAESIFDAMIELQLAAGKPDEAFRYLERDRMAVLPSESTPPPNAKRSGVPYPKDVSAALSPRSLFVSFAVLQTRTIVWWATPERQGMRSVPLSRDSLAALVRTVGRRDVPTGTSAHVRSELFRRLFDGLAGEMARAQELVVAPDRELSELSFATLQDPVTSEFVIERFTVRTVPSGEFVLSARRFARALGRAPSALVVGDPMIDSLAHPTLGPLRGAQEEASRIAAMYATSTLLIGDNASRSRVRVALPRHTIFHFAGHAVFNPDQAERSYLALAPDDSASSGELQAWEIATMRLSDVRLVVLSACATLKSRASRSWAVAGLAYSFLRAGAPRTISTLWDIPDESVMDVLLKLHENLARGMEPVRALQSAQLSALRSSREELRSPEVWGAFVYTGP